MTQWHLDRASEFEAVNQFAELSDRLGLKVPAGDSVLSGTEYLSQGNSGDQRAKAQGCDHRTVFVLLSITASLQAYLISPGARISPHSSLQRVRSERVARKSTIKERAR